jgi:hypothetical protein
MMFYSIRKYACVPFLILAVFLFSRSAPAADEITWKPVTPAEMQMKTPVVEPDADAEAIFWDVMLDDKKSSKMIYRHYVRIKIFTERGREKFAKMDIPFSKGKKVEGVAARVIKPDGTIILLPPNEIFEREIVRANKVKVLAKSFAVPGIEPGVIVEYQYNEILKDDSASGERLFFQRDIPLQSVAYHIRARDGFFLNARAFNMAHLPFKDDPENKGFQVASMTNVPALKEEPYMPPEYEVRRWVYLSYQGFFSSGWGGLARGWGTALEEFTKQTTEIQQRSAQLIAGASTPEEKLRKIYEFAQKNIKNVTYDASVTDDQKEKMTAKTSTDVLRRGSGNAVQIDLLFAALARAAGFEVAIYLNADRSDYFFTPERYPYTWFIHPNGIAVKLDNNWKYFSPATPFLPYGGVMWFNDGGSTMLVGVGGTFIWNEIPLAEYTASPARRTGKFKLLEDGTLEGKVRLEYDGHQASLRRQQGFMNSPVKREETLRDDVKQTAKNAEISDISIENFEDPSKPLTYVFNVSVPSYAQKTGKRIFLQPGFFEYGSAPVFSSSSRIYSIYFSYPWSEQDSVEIQLPKGYELDSPDAPAEVSDQSKIGALKIEMNIDKATGVLKYKRNFFFGGRGRILFPATAYTPIKNLFTAFNQADTHTVSLRQVQ